MIWHMNVGSDRSFCRPEAWKGNISGSDDFVFKFEKKKGHLGCLEDQRCFRRRALERFPSIDWAETRTQQKNYGATCGLGIAFLDQGAKYHTASSSEAERKWSVATLSSKYKPDTARRKFVALESVMEEAPTGHEDFGE